MSRVEQIEGQVKSLSANELKAFRKWFARYDAEIWDRQIEADANNGKLRSLAELRCAITTAGIPPSCESPLGPRFLVWIEPSLLQFSPSRRPSGDMLPPCDFPYSSHR